MATRSLSAFTRPCLCCALLLPWCSPTLAQEVAAAPPTVQQDAAAEDAALQAQLDLAGENRPELEAALERAPAEQQAGMRFLIRYMPQRDLKSLKADFLLDNVAYAYQARAKAPWGVSIPDEIFFNDVLPYVNINERRDNWRKDFYERFQPLLEGIDSPAKAAAALNREIFPRLKVRYSTQRRRADQGPYESIDTGLASCTGLSILLIDACRANCIPARFVGTPLWSDKSGNHSWIEVWDQDWHFTGAAEPTGEKLDQAWFIGRASQADPEHQLHAIYAVSYKHTPITFPLVWDRRINDVYAVNVTHRYLNRGQAIPEGHLQMMFRVLGPASRDRCRADLVLRDESGEIIYQGKSRDERFDANDHATAVLPAGKKFQLEVIRDGKVIQQQVAADQDGKLVTINLENTTKESTALTELKEHLAQPRDQRPPLAEQEFALAPLTAAEAAEAQKLLADDHREFIRATRAEEFESKTIRLGDLEMKFDYKVLGEAPEDGRSLYISMHGGGGAPKRVNDQQWENQKRLYKPEEGVYLAPRAPNDAWNMWHQAHIDDFYTRLIEDLIVFENVNPNRVYLTGYSAGGDGVYQLAPRMADQLAAAAMMAGHPNETQPQGLRNLPFALHVGGDDSAYNRNKIAEQWGERLAELQKQDPQGYENWVKVYPGKGHWLDREDAATIPWMAKFRRNLTPERIVWRQDDVVHTRFYWLAADPKDVKGGQEVIAERQGDEVKILECPLPKLVLRWNDAMADLEQPITVNFQDKQVFHGELRRTIAVLAKTLEERGDPSAMFSAECVVSLQ